MKLQLSGLHLERQMNDCLFFESFNKSPKYFYDKGTALSRPKEVQSAVYDKVLKQLVLKLPVKDANGTQGVMVSFIGGCSYNKRNDTFSFDAQEIVWGLDLPYGMKYDQDTGLFVSQGGGAE